LRDKSLLHLFTFAGMALMRSDSSPLIVRYDSRSN